MFVLKVCSLNLSLVFCVAVVVSVGGEVRIGEVGLCSLGVNLDL